MSEKYIRIQDMLDAFKLSEKTRKYGGDHSGYDTRMLYEIQDTIESLEPADVTSVVHGRWIWKPTKQYCPPDCWYPPSGCNEETWDEKNGTWLEDEMYCSECDYHNYHEIKYNFCPNCGAIMDGDE